MFIIAYLVWLVIMMMWDWNISTLTSGFLLVGSVLVLRGVCVILLFLFLLFRLLFGRISIPLVRATALVSLINAIFTVIIVVIGVHVTGWWFGRHSVFLEIWLPCAFYGFYHRYRKSEKQLQRDNGLI